MFKWVNWDPDSTSDKNDAERVHEAFIEWRDLVPSGLKAASDGKTDSFKRWFGRGESFRSQGRLRKYVGRS